MKGLIYETDGGRKSFIQLDAIISIKEQSGGLFKVWYAKGYTNADVVLSKDELFVKDYDEFLRRI